MTSSTAKERFEFVPSIMSWNPGLSNGHENYGHKMTVRLFIIIRMYFFLLISMDIEIAFMDFSWL